MTARASFGNGLGSQKQRRVRIRRRGLAQAAEWVVGGGGGILADYESGRLL